VTPKPELKRHELNGGGAKSRGSRRVWFDSSGAAVDTPLYLRSDLPAGTKLEGPAIVDQLDSTTVVPPGWRADVDEWLNIRMHRQEER
jgi:N-methylhydantoinase A